ncbi:MAG: hypothetical protein ACXVID_01595 [Thermoanaerobaculia bacterium]
MTHLRKSLGAASIAFALAAAGALHAAAPAGTDLWGGPGAKGQGLNARFDTNIYVSSVTAAIGSIDFLVGGATAASVPFVLSTRGVAVIAAPAAVDGMGAFLYHVRSDASVNAWSETYNDTPDGRFGTVITAFSVSDFLAAGDEAWGGGADASSSTAAGRARTNVGILCSPLSAQGCTVEVAPFDGGVPVGAAQIFPVPGSAAQQALSALIPGAAEMPKLSLRFRVLTGTGLPYAIKDDNLTSDGNSISLSVQRGAFSTAPVIHTFTLTPSSGCPPLAVTATWTTTGADHVIISGAAGSLPANGSTSFNVFSTGDIFLTAIGASGATATAPQRVTLQLPAETPTPSPSAATLSTNNGVTVPTAQGVIPFTTNAVTVTFDQHQSTGSTFVLNGLVWTYTAGTAAGVDIVRLTSTGSCGTATATFTATVLVPGPPVITSFTALPARGCSPANVVLSWTTQNARSVTIDQVPANFPYPANGSVGASGFLTTTTFTLTAFPLVGTDTDTRDLTVPVDTQPYTPILSPSNITVAAGSGLVLVTASGVPDLSLLGVVYVRNDSGSQFRMSGTAGVFNYSPGINFGTDIVRVFFTNGCGPQFAVFQATLTKR